jgi:hypothetical protein
LEKFETQKFPESDFETFADGSGYSLNRTGKIPKKKEE